MISSIRFAYLQSGIYLHILLVPLHGLYPPQQSPIHPPLCPRWAHLLQVLSSNPHSKHFILCWIVDNWFVGRDYLRATQHFWVNKTVYLSWRKEHHPRGPNSSYCRLAQRILGSYILQHLSSSLVIVYWSITFIVNNSVLVFDTDISKVEPKTKNPFHYLYLLKYYYCKLRNIFYLKVTYNWFLEVFLCSIGINGHRGITGFKHYHVI